MTTYQFARHLYNLGFSIIPLRFDTKIPVVKWKRYQIERCTPQDLVRWFGDFNMEGHHIGIITGAVSGIVAVDCDDADAVDALLDYTCTDGAIDESLVCQRTRRGMHFIYRHPGVDTRNTVRCLGAKVDVRGDGGYIRAYADAFNWTPTELSLAPVYRPLPHELPVAV